MKYLEVTFTTHPCNETVNDVVSALAGEIGFESFVECEGGIQAWFCRKDTGYHESPYRLG